MANPRKVLRIGTRGSPLALRQTELVVERLRDKGVDRPLELVVVKTSGDLRKNPGLPAEKGGFARELQKSLVEGEVDLVVHSLKDVPLQSPPGITIASYPLQDDPREAFVSRLYRSLSDMPPGKTVGTSSPRRALQLALNRPDLKVRPLTGNVETRLKKMEEGECDALILALAGLKRLGMEREVTQVLPPDLFVPAPGQGIIAVEARKEDGRVLELLSTIDDFEIRTRALAERAFCEALGADCDTATGVLALRRGSLLELVAISYFEDSGRVVRKRLRGSPKRPRELGKALAAMMCRSLHQADATCHEGSPEDR